MAAIWSKVSSCVTLGSRLIPPAGASIKAEPMFFRATREYAEAHGGPLTHAFIAALPAKIRDDPSLLLDTRSHMLFPNMYPCVPGWHHDYIPRSAVDGQPNYADPSVRGACFVLSVLGADVSAPQFYVGRPLDLPINPGIKTYKLWDRLVNEMITQGIIPPHSLHTVRDGDMVQFDINSLHRGMPATKRGWRFFARAAVGVVGVQPMNEIRQQVNVYLVDGSEGWFPKLLIAPI